jgi:high-affinity nickel permease
MQDKSKIVAGLHFGILGYLIVAIFVAAWLASAAL